MFKNENEIAELTLSKMVDFLRRKKTKLSTSSEDGRINSSINEDEIINDLKSFEYSSSWFENNSLKLNIPKSREWFDFAIESTVTDLFIPVNIKVSNCNTSQADNLNCKLGILYTLTGINPKALKLSQSSGWEKYFKTLDQKMSSYTSADYYFLVINKTEADDVFFTSLKTIQTLTPNGNNLPFQCVWSKNRVRIERSFKESQYFLLSSFKDSIEKIKIVYLFKQHIEKYIESPSTEKEEK